MQTSETSKQIWQDSENTFPVRVATLSHGSAKEAHFLPLKQQRFSRERMPRQHFSSPFLVKLLLTQRMATRDRRGRLCKPPDQLNADGGGDVDQLTTRWTNS